MADDLFGAAAPESSGAVPREIWPGVVWGEDEEAQYLLEVRNWAERYPAVAHEAEARAQVERSARWHIELQVLRAFLEREKARADKLFNAADKRALHTEWLRTHGALLTDAIVRRVKGKGYVSPHLGGTL